jgi:hypothetical protein
MGLLRVVVTRIAADGTMRRRQMDTAEGGDGKDVEDPAPLRRHDPGYTQFERIPSLDAI